MNIKCFFNLKCLFFFPNLDRMLLQEKKTKQKSNEIKNKNLTGNCSFDQYTSHEETTLHANQSFTRNFIFNSTVNAYQGTSHDIKI